MSKDTEASIPSHRSKGALNSTLETERTAFQTQYLAQIAPSVALTTLIEAAWAAGFHGRTDLLVLCGTDEGQDRVGGEFFSVGAIENVPNAKVTIVCHEDGTWSERPGAVD